MSLHELRLWFETNTRRKETLFVAGEVPRDQIWSQCITRERDSSAGAQLKFILCGNLAPCSTSEARLNSLRNRLAVSGSQLLFLNLGSRSLNEDLKGLESLQLASVDFPGLPSIKVAWALGHTLNILDDVCVISLPHRIDRRRQLLWNFSSLGVGFRFVDAKRPLADEILWREMRDMEAYGKVAFLRGEYVVGAVGCKRSVIAQLNEFLDSEHDTCLVVQDDCELSSISDGSFFAAWSQLPDNWDLLYLAASCRSASRPCGRHLIRLSGARHCTAIVFKKQFVRQFITELENCGSELDVFFERIHAKCNSYCVHPMIARQVPGLSDITLTEMANVNQFQGTRK